MGHSAVAEAAVIAIPDDQWGERPMAVVVLRDGSRGDRGRSARAPRPDFAKWQLPERVEFIEEIPRTATGKFKKTALREQFVKTAV